MYGLGTRIAQRHVHALFMDIRQQFLVRILTGILIRLDHERGDCLVQPFLALQPDLRLIIPVGGNAPRRQIRLRIIRCTPRQGVLQVEFAGALPIQKCLLFLAHDLEFHADLLEIVLHVFADGPFL